MTKPSSRERRSALSEQILAAARQPVEARVHPPTSSLGPVADAARHHEESLRAQLRKYEELRAQGRLVVKLDPKSIGPSRFRNRDPRSLAHDDPKLTEIRNSIRANGQDTPVTVFLSRQHPRPSTDTTAFDFEYEIVVGRRRHAACLQLDSELDGGFPILALIISVESDLALTKLIHRENADREDLSPFEYGLMYQDWLDRGLYASLSAIADSIGADRTVVGRYIRVTQLDPVVLEAFGDTRDIAVRWGDQIHKALKDDRAAVVSVAEKICQISPRPSPEEVKDALIDPRAAAAFLSVGAETPGPRRKRRTRSLRSHSVLIGGRVPLKIGLGKNRLVLKTLHVPEAIEARFLRAVSEYAESQIRELMEESGEDRDPKSR